MKTIEEIYNYWVIKVGYNQSEMLLKENAMKAMKEVWNTAIESAAKNAEAENYEDVTYPYKDYPGMYVKSKGIRVNKESILKLKL